MEIRFKKNDFQWELPRVLEYIKGLDEEKEYILEMKQYRRKRSLNANNLCWKMCTEIANVLAFRLAIDAYLTEHIALYLIVLPLPALCTHGFVKDVHIATCILVEKKYKSFALFVDTLHSHLNFFCS